MKYEIYLVRYASIAIEANSAEEARRKASRIDDDALDKMLYTESAWEFDDATPIEEIKNV